MFRTKGHCLLSWTNVSFINHSMSDVKYSSYSLLAHFLEFEKTHFMKDFYRGNHDNMKVSELQI